jgi:hypothetical protein
MITRKLRGETDTRAAPGQYKGFNSDNNGFTRDKFGYKSAQRRRVYGKSLGITWGVMCVAITSGHHTTP